MAAITTSEVSSWFNSFLSTTAYTKPVTPIKLALVTAIGSDTAAGTEVTGGAGPYGRQDIEFPGGLSGVRVTSNSNAEAFAGMPACTVVGVNIYDSTGTPRRLAWGPLAANKTVDAGDTLSFAAGALTLTMG